MAERDVKCLLEVGCGTGRLAERLMAELGCEVRAIDLSPRMVELSRARGVDAELGDVQALQFADGAFDCVIAAWMLYHVPNLERGLAEIARVLRPEGRLIAVTNSISHLRELWELVGQEGYELPFDAENGASILGRHFSSVEARQLAGDVTFPDRESVRRYIAASLRGAHLVDRVPSISAPLRAARRNCVFIATKA